MAIPRHGAASNVMYCSVELLLEKGAYIHCRDGLDYTPLHSAARDGHHQVVELLLKKGADPTILDKNGESPLMRAASLEHIDAVKVLLKTKGGIKLINHVDRNGFTALFKATDGGHPNTVTLMIDSGADLEKPGSSKRTPLPATHGSLHGAFECGRYFVGLRSQCGSDGRLGRHPASCCG